MQVIYFFSFKHFLGAEEAYNCLRIQKSLDEDSANFIIESLLFKGEDSASWITEIGDIAQSSHTCLVSEVVLKVELIGIKFFYSVAAFF